MDQFVAEIRVFGCNFAPVQWALCNGQILSIASNTALFSLLGTNYGGNGTTTFALPNIQGGVTLNQGQGPGLSPYSVGETGGSETVTLISNQAAAHTHLVNCSNGSGTNPAPGNGVLATSGTDDRGNVVYSDANSGTLVSMNPTQLGFTGGNQPHNNMSPYLALNFCIALQGIYPARN